MINILFDGWSLIYQPDSHAALHLMALLAYCPTEANPVVVLPASPPDWFPMEFRAVVKPAPPTAWAHLKWEQYDLPRLVQAGRGNVLHMLTLAAPLLRRLPSVVSPASFYLTGYPGGLLEVAGLPDRLREAIGRGGLARSHNLLWPDDLPVPPGNDPVIRIPPFVHPAFYRPASPDKNFLPDEFLDLNLPESFILYHGPYNLAEFGFLLNAWNWAANSIGEYYPLVLLGSPMPMRAHLRLLLLQAGLDWSVRILPTVSPLTVPAIYHRSSALFHPAAISPWGDPVRQALAAECPVVATASRLADALAGPAAYLSPQRDSRGLGAALISVVVEETLAEQLSRTARQRAALWQAQLPGHSLLAAWQTSLSRLGHLDRASNPA